MPPTIPALAYTKTYQDLKILFEIDLDNGYVSEQTFINTFLGPNIVQIALDSFGTTYTLNQNGLATTVNSLYDKQTQTKLFTGGDVSIGLVADVAYLSVDAINAAITITPEKVGKYAVFFEFNHTIQLNNTSEGTCEVTFRLTDGISVSPVVRTGGYFGTVAANAVRHIDNVTLQYQFNWTDTAPKTVTLQKFVRVATNVASNVVSASATTGEIYMRVEKI